jgi:hypothetical protein
MPLFAQQTDSQMKKSLLEQLPQIVAEGKRKAEQILEGWMGGTRSGLRRTRW